MLVLVSSISLHCHVVREEQSNQTVYFDRERSEESTKIVAETNRKALHL